MISMVQQFFIGSSVKVKTEVSTFVGVVKLFDEEDGQYFVEFPSDIVLDDFVDENGYARRPRDYFIFGLHIDNNFFNKFPSSNFSIDSSRYYRWCNTSIMEFYNPYGFSCCECFIGNEYAQPNLTNGKFLCYTCRGTKKYKYGDLIVT